MGAISEMLAWIKASNAGQVKANYAVPIFTTGFSAGVRKILDINGFAATMSAFPTSTWPRSTPALNRNYSGIFDATRGASPVGRLVEAPTVGQVNVWRLSGQFLGKATNNVGSMYLILRNPVSGFEYVVDISLPDGSVSGVFSALFITISDAASLTYPNGYILQVYTSFTDPNYRVEISSITRISMGTEGFLL